MECYSKGNRVVIMPRKKKTVHNCRDDDCCFCERAEELEEINALKDRNA
jgi:hypothetical protein